MIFPIYYCPPKIETIPPHIFHTVLTVGALGVRGEIEGIPPEDQHGRLVGATPDEAAPLFADGRMRKTRAGWYVCLAGCQPQKIARVRGIGGTSIPGKKNDPEGIQFTVPHLLTNYSGTLESAIPAVYREYHWQTPREFYQVIDNVGNFLRAIPEIPDDEKLLDLCVEILSINYHVTKHELAFADEWIDDTFPIRVIRASVQNAEE
jgi:hypothetical protein